MACRRNSRLEPQVWQVAKAGSACQLNVEQSVIDRTMTHDAAEDDPLPLYGVPEDRRSLIDAPPGQLVTELGYSRSPVCCLLTTGG